MQRNIERRLKTMWNHRGKKDIQEIRKKCRKIQKAERLWGDTGRFGIEDAGGFEMRATEVFKKMKEDSEEMLKIRNRICRKANKEKYMKDTKSDSGRLGGHT
jgi:hypothetical protein